MIWLVIASILFLIFGLNLRKDWIYKRLHKDAIEALGGETIRRAFSGAAEGVQVEDSFAALVEHLTTGYANISGNNAFDILTDGATKRDMLIDDIKNAKEYIHVEYFHFGIDKGAREIKHLLEQKAEEGVKVRFLNENIANLPIPNIYYKSMRKHGVEVRNFSAHALLHPLDFLTRLNYRNHRKIVVIDGNIAYTGGMNINDNYFKKWRDTHLRLCGDAVETLNLTFLDSWLSAGGRLDAPIESYFSFGECQPNKGSRYAFSEKTIQVVADDPLSRRRTTQEGYIWALDNAKDYIYIQTPYYAPPKPVREAMVNAAKRGVDVVMMLPKRPDNGLLVYTNRAYYQECLDAGVTIALKSGEFIHSKTFVCDDYLSQIGTSNMDFRSMELCYEVNTYIYDSEVALANKEIFEKDMQQCTILTPAEWSNRPFYSKALECLFKLFTPIL